MNNLQTLGLTQGRAVEGASVAHVCRDEDRDRLLLWMQDGSFHWYCPSTSQRQELGRVDTPCNGVTAFLWTPEADGVLVGTRGGDLLLITFPPGAGPSVEEIGYVEGGVKGAAWSPDGMRLVLVSGNGQLLIMSEDWNPLLEAAIDHGQPIGSASVEWRADGACFATATAGGPSDTHALCIWDGVSGEVTARGEAAPGLTQLLSWQPNGRHLYTVQRLGAVAAGSEAPAAAARPLESHVAAWKREARRREAAAAAAAAEQGPARPTHRVVLWERNGLQHGGFDLVAPGGEGAVVTGLGWSPGSEVLAVACSQEDGSGTTSAALQLWTRSNWHWYCKGERRFEGCGALRALWGGAAASLTLDVVATSSDVTRLELSQLEDVSRLGTAAVLDGRRLALTPLRRAVVPPPLAAASLLLPCPALCCALRAAPGEPETLAACLADGRLALSRAPCDDAWEGEARPPQLLLPCLGAGEAARLKRAVWTDATRLVLVLAGEREAGRDGQGDGGALHDAGLDLEIRWGGEQLGGAGLRARGAFEFPGRVLTAQGPVFQLACGGVVMLRRDSAGAGSDGTGNACGDSSATDGVRLDPGPAFKAPCPVMAVLPEARPHATPLALYGVSRRGELWCAGAARPVAEGVTSLALRPGGSGACDSPPPLAPWLLFTGRDGRLHTRRASVPGNTAAPEASAPAPPALAARAVEAGARLVAAPPGSHCAVLCLPRGNLEAVCPRALVLASLAASLAAGDVAAAWALATQQRVDLNLLVDARWPRVLHDAPRFLAALGEDQAVADLLSALRPGSVLAPGGVYAGAEGFGGDGGDGEGLRQGHDGGAYGLEGPPPSSRADAQTDEKVTKVCAAFRDAILAGPGRAFLRSLLVSHSRCGDLEGAMRLLRQVKDAAMEEDGVTLEGPSPTPGNQLPRPPSAEDGLRHLLLTSSADELYATALGMYELDLAYMVIAHSQKDPGEYLQELGRFAAERDVVLRRVAIDRHLRQHEAALRGLLEAGPAHFGAALQLAAQHGLLRKMLHLCRDDQEQRRAVLRAYAESLETRGLYEDAGLAFVTAGLMREALAAYRGGLHWRPALTLAGKLGLRVEGVRELAMELADELVSASRPAEAAAVRLEYCRDVDAAAALLAAAREWREGARVAASHARPDLLDRVLAPAAAARAAEVFEDVRESAARVAKYAARLEHLAARRRDLAAALAAAEAERGQEGGDDWDGSDAGRGPGSDAGDDAASEASGVTELSAYTDASLAPSSQSTRSGHSSASTLGGKRRQSAKSKRKASSLRVRQGSPEEEDQLANHLLSQAPSAAFCAEMGQLAEFLVLLGHESDARRLQQAVGELVAACAATGAAILASPPPGMLAEGGQGPSPQLALRVAAAEAEAKSVTWKWDVLRAV
ncbi:hypothetical protein ACKKBF_B04435 [Auxenochlorella protothecoides x Auxenochlorella symbiontica]